MKPWIVSISIAYLLGSIPFGYLLVRILRKEDIREQGSGNIGATNVARSGAKGLGVATLLLDLGKAYAGVWIAAHVAAALGNAGTYDVEATSNGITREMSWCIMGPSSTLRRFYGHDRKDLRAIWNFARLIRIGRSGA